MKAMIVGKDMSRKDYERYLELTYPCYRFVVANEDRDHVAVPDKYKNFKEFVKHLELSEKLRLKRDQMLSRLENELHDSWIKQWTRMWKKFWSGGDMKKKKEKGC